MPQAVQRKIAAYFGMESANPGNRDRLRVMDRIEHGRALSYVFARQGWPMTLLFVTLAMLVPLVGPITANGYQAVVARHVARHGDREWPLFDFERLADYLLRGLRVFVVSLVAGVIILPVAFVVVWVTVIVSALLAAAGGEHGAVTTCIGFVLMAISIALFLALIFGAMALVTPLWLQAGINPDLSGALDFAFLRDFLKRVGREVLIAHLVMVGIHIGLMVAGLLACFVGVFPAIGLMMLVQAHLYGQLYALYLERGGREIPEALPPRTTPQPA